MVKKVNLIIKIGLAVCLLLLAAGRIFILSKTGFARYGLIHEETGTFLLAAFPVAMWFIWRLLNKAAARIRRDLPKSFVIAAYFVIAAIYILFTTEALFRYVFSTQQIDFQSDLISGLYMIAMSVVIPLLSMERGGFSRNEKYAFLIGLAALIVLWLLVQDRLEWIIQSVTQYGMRDLDSDGLYRNWFAHRKQMPGAALFGTSAGISSMKLGMFYADKCPLVWLRSSVGWGITVTALAITAVSLYLMILLCRDYKNTKYESLTQIICISAIAQTVIGILANLFMMYSSHVGIPGLHSVYMLLPIAAMLFIPRKSEINKEYGIKEVIIHGKSHTI